MENYFASQRDRIFKNVEVLIYVFDVESRDWEKDLHYYQSCLDAILANSKEARIFCLIHKMDLVPEHQRDEVSSRQTHDPLTDAYICRYTMNDWLNYVLDPNRSTSKATVLLFGMKLSMQ
jgi:hypothetical protein